MSSANDSIKNVIIVALSLCIVCSVIVSAAAVLLKPIQVKNKTLNLKENVLRSAGMLPENATKKEIEQIFDTIIPKIVDLETGEYVEPDVAGYATVGNFDQKKVQSNPATSKALSSSEDIAGIKRRERYAKVYLVTEDGQISRVILPVRGYGLWSTLYGYLTLKGDADTVIGLGFYDHKETPGLGAEVDNPSWKAQWPGKEIYNDNWQPATTLVKGNVNPNSPTAKYSVDSLSGATLTAKGVENLMRYWMGPSGFKTFLEKVRAGEANNV